MDYNQKRILNAVTLLRVLIGWHFLFEGIIKLYNPDWSAIGYLATAQGPFKGLFSLLTTDAVLPWINNLNITVLVFVGICLILGIFERFATIAGIGILALYYLAHPPFPGLTPLNVEGNYWIVNKNLIELVALVVLYQLPTGHYFGLESLKRNKNLKTTAQ